MKANLLTVLKNRYKKDIDYSFQKDSAIKNYDSLLFKKDNEKPTKKKIKEWIKEDDKAEAYNQLRAKRNKLLSETDWQFRSDMNPSEELIKYCKDLRDITEIVDPILDDNGDLYENFDWPEKPEKN